MGSKDIGGDLARIGQLHAKLMDAVVSGIRDLVHNHDSSAKIFHPVSSDKVGSLQAETDLLLYAVGAWERTGDPYQAYSVGLENYIAFAYCAERVMLAAKEPRAASVFAFIRSVGDAKKAANGYPTKGGISRILEWHRRGIMSHPIRSTPGMISIAHRPLDWLIFARSEMFPVGEWRDGWAAVDRTILSLGMKKAAYRGCLGRREVEEGFFDPVKDIEAAFDSKVDLTKQNLRWINLSGLTRECEFAGSDLSWSCFSEANISYSGLGDTSLHGANFFGSIMNWCSFFQSKATWATFNKCSFVSSDFTLANLSYSRLEDVCVSGGTFQGADLSESIFKAGRCGGVSFQRTNLTRARVSVEIFDGCDFSEAIMTDAEVSGSRFLSCKFKRADLRGTVFHQCDFDRFDLWGALRLESDHPIPGWVVKDGVLRRDSSVRDEDT